MAMEGVSGAGAAAGAYGHTIDVNDIGTTVLMLNLERGELLQSSLADQVQQMKDQQAQIRQAIEMQGRIREMQGQVKDLQQLRAELDTLPMESISTGDRMILGRRPDLMQKLVDNGISVNTAAGGPFDNFAKTSAANNTPPYNQQWAKDLASRLTNGWEELSRGEMDQVLAQLDTKIAQVTDPEVAAFMQSKGINFTTGSPEAWQANLDNLKGYIESANSTSQLEMIRLQSITNKYNQTYEMTTNIMQKFSGSLDKVIGNIR